MERKESNRMETCIEYTIRVDNDSTEVTIYFKKDYIVLSVGSNTAEFTPDEFTQWLCRIDSVATCMPKPILKGGEDAVV